MCRCLHLYLFIDGKFGQIFEKNRLYESNYQRKGVFEELKVCLKKGVFSVEIYRLYVQKNINEPQFNSYAADGELRNTKNVVSMP